MKRVIRILLILIAALIITLGVFRLIFSSVNSTEYKLFEAYSRGYFFYKLLGVIPETYENSFEIKVTEKYNDTQVLYVVDRSGSSHPYFVLLKKDSQIEILKGYSYMFKKPQKAEFSYKRHVSESINLEVFNSYTKAQNLSKQDALEKFCLFLSRQESSDTFFIITNEKDIDELLQEHDSKIGYLKTFPETYNLITAEDINFDEIDYNTAYCWFINKGVVRLEFVFGENNAVNEVDSEIIGFLGIEVPMI